MALVVATSPAKPRAAWLLLAAGGAVLCVVDVRTLRLPVRLTITIAAADLATLAVAALLDRDPAAVRVAVAAEPGPAVGASLRCSTMRCRVPTSGASAHSFLQYRLVCPASHRAEPSRG